MKIKKIFVTSIMLVLFFVNSTPIFASNTSEPNLDAKAAILIDNKTKKVLYTKNENQKMYPASTTKILTAIIAIENCNMSDIVTADYDEIMSIPEGYATADIQIGEQLTVEQLLQLLLIHSANDAANILAKYVGGSVDSFVSIMNTKANELGLSNSHFTNAYGKHDENHYSSASDLATIFEYCLQNDTFRKIAGSASCSIPITNKHDARAYDTTNELIIPGNSNYYRYVTVGKTGYTSQAGGCLVSAAYKEDLELISVILGSNDRFLDTQNLYKYGYNNYSIKNIANENDIATQIEIKNGSRETKNLDLLVNENISALVKNSENNEEISPEIILKDSISAPIEEGSVLGKITYTINGVKYTTDLIASHSVEKSDFYTLYIPIVVIASLFLVSCIIVVLYKLNISKKSKFEI